MAPPSNPVQLLLAAVARWNASHPPPQDIDPQAELAIARHEGLSGGIGDGGHAFGPNQANDAGGVLTGKLSGLTPQQKNDWAWTPQGLAFQLSGVAGVSGGQHGAQAIRSIATRYERPANVQAEIQDALAHYGQTRNLASSAPRPPVPSPGGGSSGLDSLLGNLIGSTNESLGLGGSSSIGNLLARSPLPNPPAGRVSAPVAPFPNPSLTGGSRGGIAELLQEGTGGPTHSTGPHIHAAFTNPQLELAAIQWAQQHGLNVGENPYVGSLSPGVHAQHSYHNQTFPGMFNGRKLGEAIDVSGPGMGAFYKYLAARR